MNADSCPEIQPIFPRPVRAWETSDFKLWPNVERELAKEHEVLLKKDELHKQYESDPLIVEDTEGTSCKVDITEITGWLKNNPELAARLINS